MQLWYALSDGVGLDVIDDEALDLGEEMEKEGASWTREEFEALTHDDTMQMRQRRRRLPNREQKTKIKFYMVQNT